MTRTINADREVILAAGAIHTPQILELSGIGNASLLSSFGIPVLQDLPGVGNNLQDHPLIHLSYPFQNTSVHTPAQLLTNSDFDLDARLTYLSSRTGPWTAKPSTAVAFPSLSQITSSRHVLNLLRRALHSFGSRSSFLPPEYSTPDNNGYTLQAGYELQHKMIATSLLDSNTAAYEILNDNSGGLDLALMRPFSRGTTHITSTSIHNDPAVNPNWMAHPLDVEILLLALRFNHDILSTPSMQLLQPAFLPSFLNSSSPYGAGPGPGTIPFDISRSAALSLLHAGVGTEFHYSGTCAMLPRELGGVVDPELRVYGTANLRVVDTSVFPVVPGAHLQSVAYAVAERAADLIKGVAAGVKRG